MTEDRSIEELERRIAIVRDNLNQLIEQAAARSGAADEALASDRIAQQSEELERLTKERDALLAELERKSWLRRRSDFFTSFICSFPAGSVVSWYLVLGSPNRLGTPQEGEMLADRFERLSMPSKLAISAGLIALSAWVMWTSAKDLGWI
jgi:hypothetical protein